MRPLFEQRPRGHRGHTHGGDYGVVSSSSSEDHGKGPDITVVSRKKQVVPSLVDVASSAALLSRLTIADDRAQPVSSNVSHARIFAIDVAAAIVEAKHISVKRLYETTPPKDIDRISALPCSSSVNQSEAAQHLFRTTKSCLSYILILCDERNLEGLRHVVPRMGVPPQEIFRAYHYTWPAYDLPPN